MNARRLDDFGGLATTQVWRVDAVCQRFEAEWRAGSEPRIEDFLPQADQPQRAALFRELLALELELRPDRGERLDPREYCTRFPGHTAAIEAVFGLKPAASFEATLTSTVAPAQPPLTEVPASHIGPYKRLRKIGEGGMGVVYMAEQETPIRRQVALKIIKPGMDSDQVIARFEAERQALALMNHPGIAKVLDAGTTDTGRHYFVMELVHGIPITDYCDRTQLSLAERLELFICVCQAIQHAHQKGIIHRDIKPSNVLVTLHDGRPVPKVIDFGLAKAIDQRLTERTLFTQFGEVIGTLEYMSPEQAEMGSLDIDTRSDIYSLGVVLYELLTGSTPLGRVRLRETTYAEILRRIREEEAPKPSSRLSESAAALATIAAQRQTEPARLAKLVRGELDWIVMRAVEKDRTRRYETAGGLARDVERYLADEPVEAGPPSARYRLGKFARKHRAALATAVAFGAVLIGATAISTWLAVRATREQDKAKQSESEARAVLGFFRDKVVAAARPEGQQGGLGTDVTLRKSLDSAERSIAMDFAQQPTIEASIRDTLGASYQYLGDPALAIRQHERARALRAASLGKDHPDTLTSMSNLASSYHELGRRAEALELFQKTLALRKTRLGPDHPDTLSTMNNLANSYHDLGRRAEALKLREETLALCKAKLGPDHLDTLSAMNNLANSYHDLGRRAEALKLREETLALRKERLGPDHPDTLRTMNNLANSYEVLGRQAEALKLREDTLALCKAKLGPDHPGTLGSMHNLANSYHDLGRRAEALQLREETLALCKARLGPDHPHTLRTMINLANSYHELGRQTEALKLREETLALCKARLGPDHPDTLSAMNNLADSYHDLGRRAEALKLREETLALRQAKLGPDHPLTLASRNNLAGTYYAAGRLAEAIALHESTLKLREAKLGPDHPDTLHSRNNLAGAYHSAGRLSEAIALHEATLKLREAKLGLDDPDTLISRNNLAIAYGSLGRLAEAEGLDRDTLARRRKTVPDDSPLLANDLANLGRNLQMQSRSSEAEPIVRACLAIRQRAAPDDWQRYDAMSLLGGALLGQGRFAEAEPLVVAGYEGMKAHEARIYMPDRLRLSHAAERVVQLYEAWGKPDKAAAWKAKLGPAELPADPPSSRARGQSPARCPKKLSVRVPYPPLASQFTAICYGG